MIKIFENEEEGSKSKQDNSASLSLNFGPDNQSAAVEPPVEPAPVTYALPIASPIQQPSDSQEFGGDPISETVSEPLENIPVVSTEPVLNEQPVITSPSPWEKIEETPGREYPPFYREQELPPVPEAPAEFFAAADSPEQQTAESPEPYLASFPEEKPERELFAQTPYTPPTPEENIRNTGLAWNAGIIFFGSVGFMLILGWGADLLLGTSPWGLVGGVVLGSLIGFVQFFRISSQMFRK